MTTRSQTSSTSDKQVAAQNDGFAAPGQGQDQILDFAAADGVQAGGRFVQDDEVGIVDERLGQADAALHALGKLAHHAGAHLAQADHFQKLFVALAGAWPGGRSKRLPKKSSVSCESRKR